MSMIKGKDTKPELLVRKFLFSKGYRYKLNDKSLPGKPDIVLPKHKTVIFVNGCFWHGHENCRYFVIPKTRTQWWLDKIGKNKENDLKNAKLLSEAGWRVIRIFECDLKPANREKMLKVLINQLQKL